MPLDYYLPIRILRPSYGPALYLFCYILHTKAWNGEIFQFRWSVVCTSTSMYLPKSTAFQTTYLIFPLNRNLINCYKLDQEKTKTDDFLVKKNKKL